MLQLHKDSAGYSELDFPQFNGRGFDRVKQAVELAHQRRALAQSPEDLRDATMALRLANDIKNAEQQVARQNFEAEREKAFNALHAAVKRIDRMFLPPPTRVEIENQLDHLITLFNLKDFRTMQRRLGGLLKRIERTSVRSRHDDSASNQRSRHRPWPQSVSSLFKRGLALERSGRRREAIEVYGQIVKRNPHHRQSIDRLRKLGNVIDFQRRNQQRRQSCTPKYGRYAG